MDGFQTLFAQSFAASASLWAARVDGDFSTGAFAEARTEPEKTHPPVERSPWGVPQQDVWDVPWGDFEVRPAWGPVALSH